MPVRPTFPGVYIEEIPSGVRPITGVATSTAAFVGTFTRGLLNEAVQILSFADFEREYGGLDRNSETSYAIQQFFLNGGAEAFVVRIADTTVAAPNNARPAQMTLENEAGDEIFRLTAGRRIRGQSATNPGRWGNSLRAEIDYDTADPAEQFNLTVSEMREDGDRTVVVQSETFRNLTMRPDVSNNAIETVNQGSRLVQLDRAGLTPANLPVPFVTSFRPVSSGTLGGLLPIPAVIPPSGTGFDLNIGTGVIPGTITYPGPAPTTYAAILPFVQEAIRAAAQHASVPNGLKPLLTGATVKLIGDSTVNNNARFFVQLGRAARPFDPDTVIVFDDTASANLRLQTGGGGNVESEQAQQFEPDTGAPTELGHDGPPPAAGTTFRPIPLAVFQGSLAARTGLHALEDVDLFNILSIPEATHLAADQARTLYATAEAYVLGRRAMLIVDIPASVRTLDQMQTWLTENESLRHPNAAVYYPRTNLVDPLNGGRPRSLASSGTIGGLWARTDAGRGVWKAPAGTDARLRNVESLTYVMSDLENGTLNPLGVNCLRNFPVYSNICWGARTLEGADALASDWKYVPVRRTTLFIEESLYRGTKWVVFEPNDEPLWAQIRLNVGAFMHDLFRKGAFQGTTPREAYFVKCDGETTTQTDIDNGIVNIEVGFAPLKPAEFVIIKIQQIARVTAE
jgi:hypothetical protein